VSIGWYVQRTKERTMKRIVLTSAAILALTFATVTRPTATRADTLSTQTVQFLGPITNWCNGDVVTFSATFRFDFDLKSDSADGQHVSIQITAHGSSVAPATASGSSYVLSDTHQETFLAKPPYPYIQTLVENYHLISQGPAPNFTWQMRFHLTVNANGTAEVLGFDTDTNCS
jgi:hypothetical protein